MEATNWDLHFTIGSSWKSNARRSENTIKSETAIHIICRFTDSRFHKTTDSWSIV